MVTIQRSCHIFNLSGGLKIKTFYYVMEHEFPCNIMLYSVRQLAYADDVNILGGSIHTLKD